MWCRLIKDVIVSKKDKLIERWTQSSPPKEVTMEEVIQITSLLGFEHSDETKHAIVFRYKQLKEFGIVTLHKGHGNNKYINPAGVRSVWRIINELR